MTDLMLYLALMYDLRHVLMARVRAALMGAYMVLVSTTLHFLLLVSPR